MNMEKKICKTCGIEKSIDSFPKNTSMKSGRSNKCKICHNLNIKIDRSKKNSGYERVRDHLSMHFVTKEDWCKMYKFIKMIGYDLEKDIHKQFCEKYGLPEKKRPPQSNLLYQYSDCE